jgi:hypothetical protein
MLIRKIVLVSVIPTLIFLAGGCRPAFVGSDSAAYSAGTLYAVVSRDLDSVYTASLEALQQLEINVTSKQKDVFMAKIIAKGADSKRIEVKAKPGHEDSTELSIKVGLIGNRYRSRVIFEKIQQVLQGR